jgi:hypothetical protein
MAGHRMVYASQSQLEIKLNFLQVGAITIIISMPVSHASAEAQGNVVRAICLSNANPHF